MTEKDKKIILDELKAYIKEHLSIDVYGYYEPYSGQSEHSHRVIIHF